MLKEFAESGFINIVGGCCGTTPEHIAAIHSELKGIKPRTPSKPDTGALRLSGIEPLRVASSNAPFLMVGERTNVTGSPQFKKLILEGKLDAALTVARQQVENGANIIDINFDEGMLDSEACMKRFVNLVIAEPDISRVPIMLDSSKWSVSKKGLNAHRANAFINSSR